MASINPEKKITVSIAVPPSTLDRIDEESVSLGMSRSSFLIFCASQYFRERDMQSAINEAKSILAEVKKVADLNQMTFADLGNK